MSADKRSVTTDALQTLGTIIDDKAGRDAIHLAVEPVVAGEYLSAGEHVGIVDGVATTNTKKKLGIVDPFLKAPVAKGERFWLVVYPRQITSLRHVWSHPDFEEKEVVKEKEDDLTYESRIWIESFALGVDSDYKEIMQAAHDYIHHGDYLVDGGKFEGERVPNEFWDHYEVVTKTTVTNRGTFFSCSC